MKRSRPKQHKRKLKSGKVILVNRGVKRSRFTPLPSYKSAQDISAAKRFGGQNLKGLKKIGSGRDRKVFALDDDKVLKLAKNPGGLTQNMSESDLDFLGLGEHIETGLDYAVVKRNEPLSPESKKKLAKLRKTYKEVYERDGRKAVDNVGINDAPIYLVRTSDKFSGDDSILDEIGVGQDILNYDFNPRELFANRQWGEDSKGDLKLNDAGALNDDVSLRRFTVKHFSDLKRIIPESDPWQLKDFDEIKKQRSIFGKKGNYKDEKN